MCIRDRTVLFANLFPKGTQHGPKIIKERLFLKRLQCVSAGKQFAVCPYTKETQNAVKILHKNWHSYLSLNQWMPKSPLFQHWQLVPQPCTKWTHRTHNPSICSHKVLRLKISSLLSHHSGNSALINLFNSKSQCSKNQLHRLVFLLERGVEWTW